MSNKSNCVSTKSVNLLSSLINDGFSLADIKTICTNVQSMSDLLLEVNEINPNSNPNVQYDEGSGIPDNYGHKHWRVNGKYHREDGPACESPNGSKSWYVNGKRHRLDGPAVEYENGAKYWYLNGKRLSEDEFQKFSSIRPLKCRT